MEEMNSVRIDDPHSYAKPNDVMATHLDLDIKVDFEAKKISGTATYDLDNKTGSENVIFDTRNLKIKGVTTSEGDTLTYTIGDADPVLGAPLEIQIKPTTKKVKIAFSTRSGAAALQWLDPQQTAGKKQPFLFTQSQAILARTWLPCQDGPGMRFTYDAKVQVPTGLLAMMSATNPTAVSADGQYSFKMAQPIPAYLMALAVGDVAFKQIGPRTGVYAEPSQLDLAVNEFADMEKMLTAAEALYGAYRWERYDLIVLPPSFPFGGMENPRLTFATPTILAGDRSLTSLVAHELAHSWSGNLVTNANWNDFWLNEGFTVYFERRIMEKLYGADYAAMLAVLGHQDLMATLEEMGKDNPDTKLKLALQGRDPDDGMTDIAYEKGNALLRTIEMAVGRAKFDEFLRTYFESHAFGTMTTEGFVAYINKSLIRGDKAIAYEIMLDRWIYEPGIPESYPAPTSSRFDAVDKALEKWENGTAPTALEGTKEWSTHEWLRFLRGIPKDANIAQLTALDAAFKFTNSGNSEILGEWFMHVIEANYAPGFEALERFLIKVGRRKFLKPLYKALAATPEGKDRAKAIYLKARGNYHSVSQGTIDEILDWQ